MNLDQFHLTNKSGDPTGVYDYAIFEYLVERFDMFVIASTPYIYQDGCYHADEHGTKLKTEIRKLIYPQFIRSTTVERIFRLFLQADEIQAKPEELNQYPKHWINFQNGFYDCIGGKDGEEKGMLPHSPKYKAVNQIPHEYHPEEHLTGKAIEDWLSFIVPDADDREMLLQFCGYCLTRDTRQQKFLILCGVGGSGKSTLIRLLESIIGADNISHISLKEMTQRFAPYGLMGKLLNSCADLEIGALEDTSLLKRILGEDSMRAEPKGVDGFSFTNYARLIFSTNELPLIISERTNGFFRRLLVLKMDTQPKEARHDFLDSLLAEKDYFIHLCVDAVTRMYESGTIVTSGNSERAVQRLRTDSDSVESWISEKCILDADARTERGALFNNYETYCTIQDRTALKRNSFYRSLASKGYQEKRTAEARYFLGITINHNPSSYTS